MLWPQLLRSISNCVVCLITRRVKEIIRAFNNYIKPKTFRSSINQNALTETSVFNLELCLRTHNVKSACVICVSNDVACFPTPPGYRQKIRGSFWSLPGATDGTQGTHWAQQDKTNKQTNKLPPNV